MLRLVSRHAGVSLSDFSDSLVQAGPSSYLTRLESSPQRYDSTKNLDIMESGKGERERERGRERGKMIKKMQAKPCA